LKSWSISRNRPACFVTDLALSLVWHRETLSRAYPQGGAVGRLFSANFAAPSQRSGSLAAVSGEGQPAFRILVGLKLLDLRSIVADQFRQLVKQSFVYRLQ
jgi:hypothetical protein